jgi:hypothetical protein
MFVGASWLAPDLIVWRSAMPLEAKFARHWVGWVAGGVSIKERPVEPHLFDLESGKLA